MLDNAQALLAWIGAHPSWALLLLGLVAFLDALFIIGALIPASIPLFGAGALVALGSLNLWTAAAVAALGATMGDGLSFWLGWRYGERLFETRWAKRYPDLIAGGRRFFDRHGGKGVAMARFLGPVRAVTPALAGASGMPAWLFLGVNYLAAYVWALVYIVPGIVFGASIGLAAEVATRLAGLLVLSFGIVALSIYLTRLAMGGIQRHAHRWLGPVLDWSRRHRHLGRFGAALADPQQPETPVLAIVAAVLSLLGGIWLFLIAAAARHPYPAPMDAFIYQTLHGLQTPWGNELALAVAQLGDPRVYLPVALAVLAALLLRRKRRAAAHWLAALGFGALISFTLHRVPILPVPAVYFHGPGAAPVPRDLVMVVVIYGFLPVLLGTQRILRVRTRAYGLVATLLSLIVLARLYLGAEWGSLTLFSIAIGLLWVGALGLGYRRHRPERVFARTFLVPVCVVFIAAAGLRWWQETAPPQRPLAADAQHSLQAAEWWNGGWQQLPQQRVDVRGRPGPGFDLQWAGELPDIAAALHQAGWQAPASARRTDLLRWLTTSTPIDQLPVLPQVHAGRHESLRLRLALDADHQWLLRLWPAGWRLDDGAPLWLGALSAQHAETVYRLFRYPVTERELRVPLQVPPPYNGRLVGPPDARLLLISQEIGLYTAPYAEPPPPVAPRPVN